MEKSKKALIEKKLNQWFKPIQTTLPDIYMVGGSVRDCLLDKFPRDIDLVCHESHIGSAKSLAKLLASENKASFVPFLKKINEPCFRVVSKNPEQGFIDISPMRGNNIVSDLNLRDFTINSMAVKINPDGTMGDLTDPLDGAGDIKKKIIRISGPDVFSSDPLRMLRAFRFASALSFNIDFTAAELIKANAEKLKNISFERIVYEIIEIFKNDNACFFIRLMDEMGILEIIFPEIIPMKNCGQNAFHHLDVWEHSLLTLENCEHIINNLDKYFNKNHDKIKKIINQDNCIALLKTGSMLHDLGKPAEKSICEKKGRITFYGHEKTGGLIIDEISRRLRMSKKEREFLNILVTEHMKIFSLSDTGVKPITKMRWFRKIGDNAVFVLIQGMADIMSTSGPKSLEHHKNDLLKWAVDTIDLYFENIKPKIQDPNLITGKDLIEMGIKSGPEMGRILKQVREAQDSGIIKNHEQAVNLLDNLFTS
ncbi:Multifunctional CCA protein [Desulfonema limicola]|uniref:Multifunctional CCA protein n=1 Tax=Desulfonema limicola TaxID=45656 RepID=A0A975BEA0_9BACT|nr:HD domain-containing protein [Desulfonema limicola]QTA83932.1 Multifunctional CCA protein [Desulfonema limicola]